MWISSPDIKPLMIYGGGEKEVADIFTSSLSAFHLGNIKFPKLNSP